MTAERLAETVLDYSIRDLSGADRIELADTRCDKYQQLTPGSRQALDIAALVHELETAPTALMDSVLMTEASRALMELAGRFVSEPWHPSDELVIDRRAELAGDL